MTDAEIQRRVARSLRLATLLDGAWGIPMTRWRFGLESLLGLLPVAGDLVGAALGLGIVWHARRAGAPTRLQARMLANIGLDLAVGAVPVVGDIADIVIRKNERNARLFERWAAERSR